MSRDRGLAGLNHLATVACAALFVAIVVPGVEFGPVTGTGQDEFYNAMRALHALCQRMDPNYFVHPGLYYEMVALTYGILWAGAAAIGLIDPSTGVLEFAVARPEIFLDAARWVAIAGGIVAVAAAMRLSRFFGGLHGAMLAGVALAGLPLLHASAASIRVDTVGLAAFLIAVERMARYWTAGSQSLRVQTGLAIGFAAAANYPGGLLVGLFGVCEWHRPDGESPRSWRNLAATAALAIVTFLLLNPYTVLSFPSFLRWFGFQASVALSTHAHAATPTAFFYVAVIRQQGWPVLALVGLAAASLAWRRSPLPGITLFAALYVAAFSLMASQYERFVLVPVVLLVCAGAAVLGSWLRRLPGWLAAVITALCLILTVVAGVTTARARLAGRPIEGDYRAGMLRWIGVNLPASATLIFESDTLPLLQLAFDPSHPDGEFQTRLRRAVMAKHPNLPRLVKAQFVGAVYNYDLALLEGDEVYFLGSSSNRDYLASQRTSLPAPAAFYDRLDRVARPVVQAGGLHETLVLYRTGK